MRDALIRPDGVNEYRLRYLWIKHTNPKLNEEFLQNYFIPSAESDASTSNPVAGPSGLNLRARTRHLVEYWKVHNKIFEDAWFSGELVWRVKILNVRERSIDYIEIWKNESHLHKYFNDPTLESLRDGIRESGFMIDRWEPYPHISEDLSLLYYQKFVHMHNLKQNCILVAPLMGEFGRSSHDPRPRPK